VARKSILAQLNDAVQTIADELAKSEELKPAKVNLLTARIETLKYLHQQEQSALAAENADLKKRLAELQASQPQTAPPEQQSDLDRTVQMMLARHLAQPTVTLSPVPPAMTSSESLTPRPADDDADLVT
jgi:hypothetical protein